MDASAFRVILTLKLKSDLLSLSHFILSPFLVIFAKERERELQVITNRVKAWEIEGGTEKLAVDLF